MLPSLFFQTQLQLMYRVNFKCQSLMKSLSKSMKSNGNHLNSHNFHSTPGIYLQLESVSSPFSAISLFMSLYSSMNIDPGHETVVLPLVSVIPVHFLNVWLLYKLLMTVMLDSRVPVVTRIQTGQSVV